MYRELKIFISNAFLQDFKISWGQYKKLRAPLVITNIYHSPQQDSGPVDRHSHSGKAWKPERVRDTTHMTVGTDQNSHRVRRYRFQDPKQRTPTVLTFMQPFRTDSPER